MQRKKRGSSRYFVLIVLLACLVFFGFQGLKKLFTSIDLFNIEKIEITGNRILETDFLLNIALDLIGRNMLTVSRREITAKYENIARIKQIRIRKKLFSTLVITFEERNAIFLISSDQGDLIPIDSEKVYMDRESLDPREVLPVVNTGIALQEMRPGKVCDNEFVNQMIKLYKQIRYVDDDFFSNISQIYRELDEIYLVELNYGYRILLGDTHIEDKIRRYNFVEKNRKFEKDSVIDLRFKDKLIVRSEG